MLVLLPDYIHSFSCVDGGCNFKQATFEKDSYLFPKNKILLSSSFALCFIWNIWNIVSPVKIDYILEEEFVPIQFHYLYTKLLLVLLSDYVHSFSCVDGGCNFKQATFEKKMLYISIKIKIRVSYFALCLCLAKTWRRDLSPFNFEIYKPDKSRNFYLTVYIANIV